MNDNSFERDEFAVPTAWWPETPDTNRLKTALLEETTSVVRRRARLRRMRQIAKIGMAYGAGIITAVIAWRSAEPLPVAEIAKAPAVPPIVREQERSGRKRANAARSGSGERKDTVNEHRLTSLSPTELRRLVPDAPREEQIRLLAMAGDGYLFGRGDVVAALDCYRQVLELTPPDARRQALPHDSWLLAELRSAPAE